MLSEGIDFSHGGMYPINPLFLLSKGSVRNKIHLCVLNSAVIPNLCLA